MFNQKDMVYDDYLWNSKVDIDNPHIIGVGDQQELNRIEGYEMLYIIRSLGKSWDWPDEAIKASQKLEKTIRTKLPQTINTYYEIKSWIENNFKSFWDTL